MARSRDISKVLSSSTALATDAEVAANYAPIAAGGLVLITSTTFSATSSTNVDNCFSSSYDNYKVILNYVPTNSAGTFFYFRNNSGNVSTSNYFYKGASLTSVSSGVTWTNDTNGRNATAAVADFSNANTSFVIMDISDPFSSSLFKVISIKNGDSYADAKVYNIGFQNTASMTGINFTMGSGTMTGKIRVYGYKN